MFQDRMFQVRRAARGIAAGVVAGAMGGGAAMCFGSDQASVAFGTGNPGVSGTTFAPVVHIGPLKDVDAQLDEVQVLADLNAPVGKGSLSTHACSGGGPTFNGRAGANASFEVSDTFRLTSETMPVGADVPLTFKYSIKSRLMATVTNQVDFSGGSAEVDARVSLTTGSGSPFVDLTGTVTSFTGHDNLFKTGDLDPVDDGKSVMIMAKVGDFFDLLLTLKSADGSNSSGIPGVDCDSQTALVWDFNVGAGAQMVNITDPTQMAPTDGGADPADASAELPPRPDDLVPEPGALVWVGVCAGMVVLGRRDGRRRAE